jgi:ADP-ribose pyrophosphatase YjhB (NUDIX family)
VVLVPIDDGLLLVRRGIEPQRGRLALPGGYINLGETWQAAGAREVFEETGLAIDPHELQLFGAHSNHGRSFLLIFGLAKERPANSLSAFKPNEETTECVLQRAPIELAFPLHTQVMREFFEGRRSQLGL